MRRAKQDPPGVAARLGSQVNGLDVAVGEGALPA